MEVKKRKLKLNVLILGGDTQLCVPAVNMDRKKHVDFRWLDLVLDCHEGPTDNVFFPLEVVLRDCDN